MKVYRKMDIDGPASACDLYTDLDRAIWSAKLDVTRCDTGHRSLEVKEVTPSTWAVFANVDGTFRHRYVEAIKVW